ncbi:helix-turn-helix transcriptional regulator [Psychroserpens sp.]|uniref:helix-turn-helix domain-containing protein n=1 Tax=Psychroserpens sp. TaxID=2020870 RepID=UPI002B277383|nr:helix-turn-helix transcriptional regulator [Psychroserpens sp.]
MKIDILYSFVIAAIFQGLLLGSFILFSKKYNLKSAKFLGLMLLMVALSQLQYFIEDLENVSWHEFNLIYLPFGFLEIPFLYFFIKFYLYPKSNIKKVEWLLFIPAVFFMVNTIAFKIVSLITNQTWKTNQFLNESSDLTDSYGDYVNILLLLIVLCILFIKIRNYKKRASLINNQQIISEFIWLRVFLILLLITTIPWLYYTYQYMLDENAFYMPMDLIVSIIIYIMGYIGMHKLNILSERKKIRSSKIENYETPNKKTSKNNHISRLEDIVYNNKRYLDSNISLDQLSEELQLSKSHLSRIINAELNTNFSGYINSLRVDEAKKLLLNPEFSKYTLVSIGLESGFNSKTTFNNTFKKFTGQTPSQFRKNTTN